MIRTLTVALALVILIAGNALAAGSQPQDEPSVDTENKTEESMPEETTDAAANYKNYKGDTFKKIARAKKAGEITADQAILYKVYAIFDLDKLPEKYRGQLDGRGVTPFLMSVRSNFDSYSPELQEKLKPYLGENPGLPKPKSE